MTANKRSWSIKYEVRIKLFLGIQGPRVFMSHASFLRRPLKRWASLKRGSKLRGDGIEDTGGSATKHRWRESLTAGDRGHLCSPEGDSSRLEQGDGALRRVSPQSSSPGMWTKAGGTEARGTRSPVGTWTSLTALSVVFTCCPPAPLARNVSIRKSLGSTFTSTWNQKYDVNEFCAWQMLHYLIYSRSFQTNCTALGPKSQPLDKQVQ